MRYTKGSVHNVFYWFGSDSAIALYPGQFIN